MRTTWGVFCSLITVTASFVVATAVEGAGLSLDERVRYQERIQDVYRSQRSATKAAGADEGAAVEGSSEDRARRTVVTQLRMADALATVWDRSVTGADLQAEYARILESSRDPEMLFRLIDALDGDAEAIAECLVQPILVRRLVHESYWWDPGIHGARKRSAELELLSDDGHGELPGFTGQVTETEWRVLGAGQPAEPDYEDGVQIRYVDRGRWQQLLAELGRRWGVEPATAGGAVRLPLLAFAPLDEQREYVWSSVILHQDESTVRMRSFTWWKRTFSDWWASNESAFSAEFDGLDGPIRLGPPTVPVDVKETTKDRAVGGDAWLAMNTSDPDAPLAREQHTAVWTGTHMIIWGGTNGTQVFNSGGVYDPATDSWSATSQGSGCPSARIGHTAIWVANRMVVWGGWNGSTNYDTGSRYNPTTNTWTALAHDANTPSARHGHGAWSYTSSMYVWGGATATSRTRTGGVYWFDSNSWSPFDVTADTPSARDKFVTVTQPAISFYSHVIWGGDNGGTYLADGGKYTGTGWKPIESTDAPSPRFGHTGVPTGGVCTSYPRVIVWGGFAPYDPIAYTNTGGEYSVVGTGAWMEATPTGAGLPSGRQLHTAVMDMAKDVMIVWGGYTSSGETSSGGLLDLCTDAWTPTDEADPDLPSARSGHTAVWTGESMLVWGGSSGGATALGDGAVYTFCWGTGPVVDAAPDVVDDDPCAATGIRVAWDQPITWNDYDVDRTVDVVRDGVVIAADVPAAQLSYLDSSVSPDQSYDYHVVVRNSCGAEAVSPAASAIDRASSAPTVTVSVTAVDSDGCTASSGIDVSWPQDPGGGWNDNGYGDRKYRVWRYRYAGEGWVALGSQLDYGTTTFHDPNPNLGSYYVKYINGCGDNTDTVETPMILDLDGVAPTVSQTAGAADADSCEYSGNNVSWPQDPDFWGDNDTGDRQYRVRRSTDGVNFNPIGDNLAYGVTTFVDSNASPDQTYFYEVRYKNGCDLNGDSGSAIAADTVIPTAPTVDANSSANDPDKCDDGGVVISWDQDPTTWCDTGAGGRSYDILRDGSPIQTGIAYGTTTFVDTTGANGTPYSYQVRYNNNDGLSSVTAGSTGNDRPLAPATPFNNTALDLDRCAADGVRIAWQADPDGNWGDGNTGDRGYDVLRDGAVVAAGVDYGVTEFTDTTGTAGQTYTYTVRYVNGCGLGTETAPGADQADDVGVAPVLSVAATAGDPDSCTDGGVEISWPQDADDWGDSGEGTRTYDLLRDGAVIQSDIAYATTLATDTTGTHGTRYTYQVRFNNGCGQSADSAGSQTRDLPVAPDPPANNNTAADIDSCAATGVLVTWDADPDGNWGDGGGTHTYEVLRDGVPLQSGIPYGTTDFTDLTGTAGVAYHYSVRYRNCGGLTVETTGVAVVDDDTTPDAPAAPVVVDASGCAQDGVWISWDEVPGAAGYDLRVDGVAVIGDVTSPVRLDPGDSAVHGYEVRAQAASCSGPWSETTDFADTIDPDIMFCDGFETGDSAAWTATVP